MGLIHLDAGAIIGFLDRNDVHHDAARALLADTLHVGDRLALASSAFAECLVGPARLGDTEIQIVRELVDRLPISIIPLDVGIATAAARLRAAHPSLRLPDALVIATAIEDHADELVTTDRKWPTAKALKIRATLKHLWTAIATMGLSPTTVGPVNLRAKPDQRAETPLPKVPNRGFAARFYGERT